MTSQVNTLQPDEDFCFHWSLYLTKLLPLAICLFWLARAVNLLTQFGCMIFKDWFLNNLTPNNNHLMHQFLIFASINHFQSLFPCPFGFYVNPGYSQSLFPYPFGFYLNPEYLNLALNSLDLKGKMCNISLSNASCCNIEVHNLLSFLLPLGYN